MTVWSTSASFVDVLHTFTRTVYFAINTSQLYATKSKRRRSVIESDRVIESNRVIE